MEQERDGCIFAMFWFWMVGRLADLCAQRVLFYFKDKTGNDNIQSGSELDPFTEHRDLQMKPEPFIAAEPCVPRLICISHSYTWLICHLNALHKQMKLILPH